MARGSMRAARLYGPGQPLRLETTPIPAPAPGESLVRVRATGICHTELHMLDGVLNLGVTPLTPGHEVVGEVAEMRPLGSAGAQTPRASAGLLPGSRDRDGDGVALGQRVLLYYYAPCGACRYCRGGDDNLCPNVTRQLGFTADGGYAEYLVAPTSSLVPLPAAISDEEAAGLACGGATALHAARAVANVRAGETAVVYGIGGVGCYLVQLCALAGARVIAIGRTQKKLDLAASLGAHVCVNATQDDPLAAVHDATRGEGAEVVFDLVASEETMAAAPRMLARRGRLVFAGYGGEPLRISPLWLVLRELQVRGAVGNTLAELREAVDLAAAGCLRSVVDRSFPLEQVNEALAALRGGELVGRALLVPSLDSGAVAVSPTSSSRREDNAVERETAPTQSEAAPQGPQPVLPGEARALQATLISIINRGIDDALDDDAFNALALRLFAYQYERNDPYRAFCDYRRATPAGVAHWTELPAVPIGAFKEAVLATEPVEGAAALFTSSGTTRADRRSRHYHATLDVYDACTLVNFREHVVPDRAPLPFLVLNPPPAQLPSSSLAYYLGHMLASLGAGGSGYFVDGRGLKFEELWAALEEARERSRPVALLGTTFAFVHLLDRLAEEGTSLRLPGGSRAFDTGGVKGRSREISRGELETALVERFGIPAEFQVNMYGLTELSTQFIDSSLRDHVLGAARPRRKTVPPWARTRVLDPETLRPLPDGTQGVLCHTDLANWASVCTVLTEDLGVARDGGFEILGRLRGSEARGCSIAMDELLAATGRRP